MSDTSGPETPEARSPEARSPEAEARPRKASLRHRLYHGETSFEFVGRRWWWFGLSGVVIALGLLSLLTQGLNYGIDFKGGTSWTVRAPGVSVAKARDAIRPLGLADAKIQIAGNDTLRVEFRHEASDQQTKVTEKLASLAKVDPNQVSVDEVGPSWGKAVTNKARTALIVFFILITIYISLRFEWKMALAAIIAVIHDIIVTVGIYSVSRFEVTPATVVAFLTILGYSLYDTVVVFDKVQENTKAMSSTARMTYSDMVNLSMNQVLMRSINTSLVAIMPILSVLVIGSGVLGATALKDFGLALLIGLLTGAYSSIFVASPILAMLKEREPRYVNIRQRLLAKGGTGPLTPAAAAAQGGVGGGGGRGSGGGGGGGKGRGGGRSGKPDALGAGDGSDPDVLVPAGRSGNRAGSRTGGAANRPRPGSGSGGSRSTPPRPRKKGKKR